MQNLRWAGAITAHGLSARQAQRTRRHGSCQPQAVVGRSPVADGVESRLRR